MFTNFFRSILRKWMKRWNSVGSRRSFYTNQCGDLYTRSIVYALTCYKTPTESLSLGAAYGEKGILHCLVEIRQIWTCAKSGDNDNKTSSCVTRLVSLTFCSNFTDDLVCGQCCGFFLFCTMSLFYWLWAQVRWTLLHNARRWSMNKAVRGNTVWCSSLQCVTI